MPGHEGLSYRPTISEQATFTYTQPKAQVGLRETLLRTDAVITNIDTILKSPGLPRNGLLFQAPPRSEAKTAPQENLSSHYFLSAEWLANTVDQERKKPLPQGEAPWYHLPGTGFWTKEQAAQLVRNTKGAMKEVAPDVLHVELAKVKQDMSAFVDEYLEQMVNLRFNLAWKEVEGEQRIVCPEYGNVLWESITDPMEREGAVYEAIAGKEGLETKLRSAPNGSIAIAVSNEGWSGLHDADGNEICFDHAQVYAIKKTEDGNLQAYTLRYKANTIQNEILQRELGLDIQPTYNQKERIKNIMKNTALITPEDARLAELSGKKPVKEIADVIDLMQEAVGGRVVAYEGKTFDEMRLLSKNPEVFMQHHPLVDPLIRRFQDYARIEIQKEQPVEELQTKLEIAMASTILQMNRLYREEEKFVESSGRHTADCRGDFSEEGAALMLQEMSQKNLKGEVEDLQKRPGCSGGGKRNSGGSRYSINRKYVSLGGGGGGGQPKALEKKEEKQEWFSCSECGWEASGPIGDSACGGCGFTKEQYAEKYGVIC